jgi:hypothetical protein
MAMNAMSRKQRNPSKQGICWGFALNNMDDIGPIFQANSLA